MEGSQGNSKRIYDLEKLVKKTTVWANIFICLQFVGIVFAIIAFLITQKYNRDQMESAEKYEKRKNAIEAVNKVYNNEFLSSFSKLKAWNEERNKRNNDFMNNEDINAWNLVFSTYYAIAIVYNNKIADTLIIKESIKKGISDFVDFPEFKDSTMSQAEKEIVKMNNSIKENL